MTTKVSATCENGHEATVSLDFDVTSLKVGGEIIVGNPKCPLCGGTFKAPGGTYEKDNSGLLIRTGD